MREALPQEPGRCHSRSCAKGERHAPLYPVIPGERSGSSTASGTASGTAFEALPEARGQTRILAAGRAMEAVTDAPFTLLDAARGAGGEARAPRAIQGPSYARSRCRCQGFFDAEICVFLPLRVGNWQHIPCCAEA